MLGETLGRYHQQIVNREVEERPDTSTPFGLVLAHYVVGISRLLNPTLCWNYIQFLKVCAVAMQILYKCFEEHAE